MRASDKNSVCRIQTYMLEDVEPVRNSSLPEDLVPYTNVSKRFGPRAYVPATHMSTAVTFGR